MSPTFGKNRERQNSRKTRLEREAVGNAGVKAKKKAPRGGGAKETFKTELLRLKKPY